MKSLIFDLDGTLADTGGDLIAAANATFRDLGFDAPLDVVTDAEVGLQTGGRAMLKHGFMRLGIQYSEAEIEKYYQPLVDNYAKGLCIHSHLYPGCKSALERLRVSGVPMAVCTNKPARLAEPLLSEFGISHYFKTVIAADTLAVRKPHPEPLWAAIEACGGDPKQSILVGDSVTDRETARRAGAASMLVTFGPLADKVRAFEPQMLLNSYAELDNLLDEFWGQANG